jgi:hypothetical protein
MRPGLTHDLWRTRKSASHSTESIIEDVSVNQCSSKRHFPQSGLLAGVTVAVGTTIADRAE